MILSFTNHIDWDKFWVQVKDHIITVISGRQSSLFITSYVIRDRLSFCNVEGSHLLGKPGLKSFYLSPRGTFSSSRGEIKIMVPARFFVAIESSTGIYAQKLAKNLFEAYLSIRHETFSIMEFPNAAYNT